MRHTLFVFFLLASLPAALAQAEPFAEYNPATGDIFFREMSGSALIVSQSAAWHPDVLSSVIITTPVGLEPPRLFLSDSVRLSFGGPSVPALTSMTIRAAVIPGTPISDLTYFDGYRVTSLRQGVIKQVPEPTAGALLTCSLAAVVMVRRRRDRSTVRSRG